MKIQSLRKALSSKRTELARLRAKWGKPGDKDAWLASRYFDLTRGPSEGRSAHRYVDERTWADLEFPAIFSQLDSTETPIGAQALFHQLREYIDDPGRLKERCATYDALRADTSLREEIQLKLAALSADSNADIANFIFGQPPEKPKYHRLLPAWSLFSAAVLLGVVLESVPVILWFAVLAINAIIVFRGSLDFHRNAATLMSCYCLLRVADGLASLRAGSFQIPQLNRLAEETPQRAGAKRALRLFAIFRGPNSTVVMNELAESLYFWLNFVFLAELVAYARTVDGFVRVRSQLASDFELVGSLDAAVAIASYLEQRPDHCRPAISARRALIEIEQGYHPLIVEPVKNSIRLDGRSALITGSNMAGKTTFIKMIGVNLIFGRTLGFCLAAKAAIPRSSVMASIRGEHSVESGKSHYFGEIEAIHSFIENAERGECEVFVIDELFSGTNTIERLAAARAVLECLCENAQILVTTHDVELQAALRDSYDLYHFQEDPDVEGFFDYRLQSGETRARNAIRLLERLGFPAEVVAAAMTYTMEDRIAVERSTV